MGRYSIGANAKGVVIGRVARRYVADKHFTIRVTFLVEVAGIYYTYRLGSRSSTAILVGTGYGVAGSSSRRSCCCSAGSAAKRAGSVPYIAYGSIGSKCKALRAITQVNSVRQAIGNCRSPRFGAHEY